MHYFLTGVKNYLTIMAFWGQQLWLAGAFAKLALVGIWLYVLLDINWLNPQPLSTTDWFFFIFIPFGVFPMLLSMVYGRLRLTLGYPEITLDEQQRKSVWNKLTGQFHPIGIIWLMNIAGVILVPVAAYYLVSLLSSF